MSVTMFITTLAKVHNNFDDGMMKMIYMRMCRTALLNGILRKVIIIKE